MQSDLQNLKKSQDLFAKAEILVKEAEEKYVKSLGAEKDGKWYLTALKQGTLTDRISALQMLVQRNPQAALSQLMQLLTLARKPNLKMAEQAICAIKDLLIRGELFDKRQPSLSLFTKNPKL